jgi:hypothetical protein
MEGDLNLTDFAGSTVIALATNGAWPESARSSVLEYTGSETINTWGA